MKLLELAPRFLAYRKSMTGEHYQDVATFAEADGVIFSCPKCTAELGSIEGAHSIIVWNKKIPEGVSPRGGRWDMSGTGLADLTISPSVAVVAGCGWHGFVRNGGIVNA